MGGYPKLGLRNEKPDGSHFKYNLKDVLKCYAIEKASWLNLTILSTLLSRKEQNRNETIEI